MILKDWGARNWNTKNKIQKAVKAQLSLQGKGNLVVIIQLLAFPMVELKDVLCPFLII